MTDEARLAAPLPLYFSTTRPAETPIFDCEKELSPRSSLERRYREEDCHGPIRALVPRWRTDARVAGPDAATDGEVAGLVQGPRRQRSHQRPRRSARPRGRGGDARSEAQ